MASFGLSPFLIGVVSGMRSFSAPALVSHSLSEQVIDPLPDSRLHFLTNPTVAKTLAVLAAAELVGDKIPNVPDRITPQPLLFRAASGAVCGAALNEAEGKPGRVGAVLGAAGALVGAYTFFYLRQYLTAEKGLPDPVVALLEDALAIGTGWQVTQNTPINAI